MKKSLSIITIMLLTSCSNETILVWNWKDVIGLSMLALLFGVALILFVIAWIGDKWNTYLAKKRKAREDNFRQL